MPFLILVQLYPDLFLLFFLLLNVVIKQPHVVFLVRLMRLRLLKILVQMVPEFLFLDINGLDLLVVKLEHHSLSLPISIC